MREEIKHEPIPAVAMLCCATALRTKDIKIAPIYLNPGAFDAYGVDSHRGLILGL